MPKILRTSFSYGPQTVAGDAKNITELALRAVEGYREFQRTNRIEDIEDLEDFRHRVTEVPEDCFPRYAGLEWQCRKREETGEDKFRTFDGSCNNLKEVKSS